MSTETTTNWNVLALSRFLLAMVVMIGHLTGFANLGIVKFYAYFGSFEAILGFLLISGFSIGKSILKNKEGYFSRRLQRIYPVYVISVLYQLIAGTYSFDAYFILLIVLNLLFLNQLFISYSLVGPAWTLSTEIWLYCLAPLFLKMSSKWLNILIFLSFGSYILYTCGRTIYHWDYYSTTNYGINLLLLSFIWIAGFKLAVHTHKTKQNKLILLILFAAHVSLTVLIQVLYRIKHGETQEIFRLDIINFIGGFLCVSFAYIIVVFNNIIPQVNQHAAKIFNFLGNISYPLYLSHLSSFILLKKLGVTSGFTFFTTALAVSILIYLLFDFYSKKRINPHERRIKLNYT